jgi:antitoxin ParD1/3/4
MGIAVQIELTGPLAEHVAAETGDWGLYQDAGEYVRDLIRRDLERSQDEVERYKAELRVAFAAPSDECVEVTAADVIERNRIRRAA